jgi:hypothetical protein
MEEGGPVKSWLLLLLALTGCATQVYHPTRTRAEQERDIRICSEHGKLAEPMEPVAALNVAYQCLEKKGYRRGRAQPVHG